jgi:hypothetical protein
MAMAAPAAPAHIAAPADTNGQPDPDPDTLTMDISVPLCESSGHNYCLGDGGGTQFLATHANATPVKFNYNHNTFTWGGVTYNVGTLNEPSQSPACLGFNGNGNITRQNCSTGTGIIWGAGLSNGHHVWINRLKTQQQNGVFVLAASDGLNSLLFTSLYPPGPTVFERWTSG